MAPRGEILSYLQLGCILDVSFEEDNASHAMLMDQGFNFGTGGEAVKANREELCPASQIQCICQCFLVSV